MGGDELTPLNDSPGDEAARAMKSAVADLHARQKGQG